VGTDEIFATPTLFKPRPISGACCIGDALPRPRPTPMSSSYSRFGNPRARASQKGRRTCEDKPFRLTTYDSPDPRWTSPHVARLPPLAREWAPNLCMLNPRRTCSTRSAKASSVPNSQRRSNVSAIRPGRRENLTARCILAAAPHGTLAIRMSRRPRRFEIGFRSNVFRRRRQLFGSVTLCRSSLACRRTS